MNNKENKEEEVKGIVAKKDNYTVEVKYSDEAIKEKLVKFTLNEGESFEISADELISILVNQVSSETLAPTFVESTRVNVVQVLRSIKAKATEDIPKGKEFSVNYTHPYPLEFAILEEAYKIARIERPGGVMVLTKEFIDEVKEKIKPESEGFIKQFYKSFKETELSKDDTK